MPQAPKNRDGIWKKLQDETTRDGMEGSNAIHVRDIAFSETHLRQSRVSNSSPCPGDCARIAFYSHDLARRANKSRDQYGNVTNSRADIQNTLARGNTGFTEESLGTGR